MDEHFVFMDNTRFIEQMEAGGFKNNFYLRPRRFGKSLLLSVLEYYYDTNKKDQFQKLFGQYYTGKNPTRQAGAYRILKFDFSAIDTKDRECTKQGFNESVASSVKQFCNKNSLFDAEQSAYILAGEDAEKILTRLFKEYPKDAEKICLLIDEYDHFTNEVLLRNAREFADSVSKNSYVRKFYEAVKSATQSGVLACFFVTGVSPVTLDALTSGFNIATLLSLEPAFHDMLGFTEAQVRDLVQMAAEPSRFDAVMEDMRLFYNGYRFLTKAKNSLYNPDMVLYFLRHYAAYAEYPDEMLDLNVLPDYGKLKMLFERLQWTDNQAVLHQVLRTGGVEARLVRMFDFERGGFGRDEFASFLYYMGNLTVAGTNQVNEWVFKIPNKVIETLYWQYYARTLETHDSLPLHPDPIAPTVRSMAMGDPQPFFDSVQNVLNLLSNRDFQGFDEKYIQLLFVAHAIQSPIFFVQTEREIPGGAGCIDMQLSLHPHNRHRPHAQYVFEFKYLKKSEAALSEKKMLEALEQLRRYKAADPELRSNAYMRFWAVVVVKDELHCRELKDGD